MDMDLGVSLGLGINSCPILQSSFCSSSEGSKSGGADQNQGVAADQNQGVEQADSAMSFA